MEAWMALVARAVDGVGVFVIIAGMVINQVWQTYDVTVATARREIQQFTQILEANTDITLQAVTLILDHSVEAALDQINDPQ